jgi:hypothetical protein
MTAAVHHKQVHSIEALLPHTLHLLHLGKGAVVRQAFEQGLTEVAVEMLGFVDAQEIVQRTVDQRDWVMLETVSPYVPIEPLRRAHEEACSYGVVLPWLEGLVLRHALDTSIEDETRLSARRRPRV